MGNKISCNNGHESASKIKYKIHKTQICKARVIGSCNGIVEKPAELVINLWRNC